MQLYTYKTIHVKSIQKQNTSTSIDTIVIAQTGAVAESKYAYHQIFTLASWIVGIGTVVSIHHTLCKHWYFGVNNILLDETNTCTICVQYYHALL